SARSTTQREVSIPGSASRSAPPGLTTLYHAYSVRDLRNRAEQHACTRPYAEKARQMGSALDRTEAGCCQQPLLGAMIYSAHYQDARQSMISALRLPRDEVR